jgi:hypothetical protein
VYRKIEQSRKGENKIERKYEHIEKKMITEDENFKKKKSSIEH